MNPRSSDEFEGAHSKRSFSFCFLRLPLLHLMSLPAPQRKISVKVALVTGAARGIGRAIALRLAVDGCESACRSQLEAERKGFGLTDR